MKTRTGDFQAEQSAYLLEYDRRRILNCADTFRSLAAVLTGMNLEEEEERERERQDREKRLQQSRAREDRKQYAAYLKQVAGLMQAVAGTSVQLIRLGGRQERQIVRALAGEGIWAQDLYLLRGQEGRLEISVSVCTKRDTSVTAAEIAGYLSVLMDLRLVPEKRNPYFVGMEPVSLYFEEEPAFCCLTAAATAVKENETVSGDSHSFWEEDGAITMILSDGVGSGENARQDSSRVVDLTEQILDAGLGGRMAVQLLNGLIGAEGDEERMATLDVCRIDLKKGECAITKAGGASTFIKRDSDVEKVSLKTLPLGLWGQTEEREAVRSLQEGDMIVMISDGVVEDWPCGDGEEHLMRRIGEIRSDSPVDLANHLLRYAIGQCRGQIRDDMTVLVTGIWKNGGRRVH